MNLSDMLLKQGWKIVSTNSTKAREKQLFSIDSLALTDASKRLLNMPPANGRIYGHQKEAIESFLRGEHVCMSTGTASGKTLPFQITAIECLAKNPESRIVAIYPMKALGREQKDRWREALAHAGLESRKVGLIDGSVKGKKRRLKILSESSVLIFTPDIIHAWLLFNLTEPTIQKFLSQIDLVIVDEVHTYAGVFGSNAAFLFRRLRHLVKKSLRFFGASATIAEPAKHLQNLFGVDFTLVDQTSDTSPKHELEITLVNPPTAANFLTEVTNLLGMLHKETDSRFIAFVDSRIQVEQITSILARLHEKEPDEPGEEDGNEEVGLERLSSVWERLNILPYRSGYEQADRNKIQKRLTAGTLRGVVSTSALELGIDIKGLDTCVLIGVPNSSTSLHQRIGRIGRHGKGHVIVINGGTIYDRAVFADPKLLLNRPLAESALYLENQYIQYIHALCLARLGGEHDQIHHQGKEESDFQSEISWPAGFLDLCHQERLGQLRVELQRWKTEGGDRPNHAFPLRDIESQFYLQIKQGQEQQPLGQLSYSQLMRETYPGAVYYHLTTPYRVLRVSTQEKRVDVRREKHYTTKPVKFTSIFPNLTESNVFDGRKQGKLVAVECNLQIGESISGFKERRGPNEFNQSYPLVGAANVYYDQPYFSRHVFTTGVILSHPALNNKQVQIGIMAELFFEGFLLVFPFERQDINFGTDKHRQARAPLIAEAERFICVYDQTYGSLRLTRRLMEKGVLTAVLQQMERLAVEQEALSTNDETRAAIRELVQASQQTVATIHFNSVGVVQQDNGEEEYARVICPGSKGINLLKNNEHFEVLRVVPGRRGLRYEGKAANQVATTASTFASIEDIAEIPGESQIGYYYYLTGEIVPEETPVHVSISEPVVAVTPAAPAQAERPRQVRELDLRKLEMVLVRYFDAGMLRELRARLGVTNKALLTGDRVMQIRNLVALCQKQRRGEELLAKAFQLYRQVQAVQD